MTVIDKNIQTDLEYKLKSGAKSWRLIKLESAIAYREAGNYPVSDVELERIIKDLVTILSQEK